MSNTITAGGPQAGLRLHQAQALVAAGISVIPIRRDGSKAPAIRSWKPYQQRRAHSEELEGWFGSESPPGLAVVCGAASHNIKCLDIDDAGVAARYTAELARIDPELFGRLVRVATPSGGCHFWFRCAGPVPGNERLACRLPTDEERRANPRAGAVVQIETRGEGGYALIPGCPADCHPTGNEYRYLGEATLEQVATLSDAEYETLMAMARSFDRSSPRRDPNPVPMAEDTGRLSPADDYDRRGSWQELLEPRGWTLTAGTWEEGQLRRPGKDRGSSASVGVCRGSHGEPLLYVFSTNVSPLEGGRAYGLFQAARLLRFGGDGAQASRDLRSEGYGSTPAHGGAYAVRDGRIGRYRMVDGEWEWSPLANFSATIVSEVVYDDGTEQERLFHIHGCRPDGQPYPPCLVPACDFGAMEWVPAQWGATAIISAGQGTRDALRAAIQTISGDVPRHVVYRHTGWVHHLGQWMYVHAGGGIAATGAVAVSASLHDRLALARLPDPPTGTALAESVRASLGLLDLGPDRITIPLLGTVYRAPLGPADLSLFLAGVTGTFKTELAALIQQHFGAGFLARALPANWTSTENALEALAFAAKDMVMVVDDYAPVGSSTDRQRLHRAADRLFRNAGNGAGRQRLRSDTSHRPPKPPRCVYVVTGEDIPPGQSLNARLVVLDVSPGDLGPQGYNPRLAACQRDAAAGRYAAAMAGYVQWLAGRFQCRPDALHSDLARAREALLTAGGHPRTAYNLAELLLGWWHFLAYARDAGALGPDDQARLAERGQAALLALGSRQAAPAAEAGPAQAFLALLDGAVATGKAHLAGRDGRAPAGAGRRGWRDGHPCGDCIGWCDGDDVYLDPVGALAVARRLADAAQIPLVVSATTLKRRLHEVGLLRSIDEQRGRMTVRRSILGQIREVIHVVWPTEPAAGCEIRAA